MRTDDVNRGVAESFWDELYGKQERVWSGNPNSILVRGVTGMTAGTALDLGCGEGADAIWLAQQGWLVTAVDVSQTALRRAEGHAESAGVSKNIDWQQHDLTFSFSDGSFDLVSAQFLHSPVDFPRERILRTAAGAVAPGGRLLVVGHAGVPPWAPNHQSEVYLPTPQDVLESLQIDPEQWKVELLESPTRDAIGPAGQSATLTDSVLMVMRLTS